MNIDMEPMVNLEDNLNNQDVGETGKTYVQICEFMSTRMSCHITHLLHVLAEGSFVHT